MDLNSGKESISNCMSTPDALAIMSNCTEHQSFASIHDKNGMYIQVSDSFRSITGFGLQDVEGDSAYSLFDPDDVKEVLKSHASVTLKPEVSSVSVRFRKKDGSYVKLESYSKQLQGEENEGIIVVFSHIVD